MSVVEFDHKRERRSMVARYAELETEISKRVDAALYNETLTRERVTNIEAWLRAFTSKGLFGRLKWLIAGR